MTNEELQARLWEAEKELMDLRKYQFQRNFKVVRDLASHCLDDQGRVQWDLLEQALFSDDGRITLIPCRPAR